MLTSEIDQEILAKKDSWARERYLTEMMLAHASLQQGCVAKSSEGKESEGMNGYYLIVSSFGFTRSDSSSKLFII